MTAKYSPFRVIFPISSTDRMRRPVLLVYFFCECVISNFSVVQITTLQGVWISGRGCWICPKPHDSTLAKVMGGFRHLGLKGIQP